MLSGKQKFLFINSLYHPNVGGGAEIIMQIQAEGLVRRGFDVTVLATSDKVGLSSAEVLNGVKIYRAGIKNFYWQYNGRPSSSLLKLGWHLRDMYNFQMKDYVTDVIEKEGITLVFCHNLSGWSVSVFDAIKSLGIPVVQVLHDQYFRCPNSNMFNGLHACKSQCAKCSVLRYIHKSASSKVDAVVGVSKFVLDSMISSGYFNDVPSYVINNARTLSISESYKVWSNPRELKFGYLGTLAKSKGIELLLEEFSNLNIESTLFVGGKGMPEYEEYLKSKYENNKSIQFLGYVKPREFYELIDISIVPSIWPDTFPGVAFESLAYSVPVIANDIGGLPEIVKHEINGILCDTNVKNSISNAMLKLFEDRDLLLKLIENSKDSVKPYLSVDRMLNEYLEVCTNILT